MMGESVWYIARCMNNIHIRITKDTRAQSIAIFRSYLYYLKVFNNSILIRYLIAALNWLFKCHNGTPSLYLCRQVIVMVRESERRKQFSSPRNISIN